MVYSENREYGTAGQPDLFGGQFRSVMRTKRVRQASITKNPAGQQDQLPIDARRSQDPIGFPVWGVFLIELDQDLPDSATGELRSRAHQKGTEEIAGEDLAIRLCFLAAISYVPLPAATLQFSWIVRQPRFPFSGEFDRMGAGRGDVICFPFTGANP
jgi:hypothetical protein